MALRLSRLGSVTGAIKHRAASSLAETSSVEDDLVVGMRSFAGYPTVSIAETKPDIWDVEDTVALRSFLL